MSQTYEYSAAEPAPSEARYRGPERRSSDPLNALGRRVNHVCVAAVDPLQIAAALEADGVNDELAVGYGVRNVFELAEHLYYRVPLRLPQSAADPGQRRQRGRELSHGVLFALPGLFYPALVAFGEPAAATLGIALSVIVGWGWSQVMVRVAYLLLGRAREQEAAQWLRLAALIGVGGVAAAGLLSVLFWAAAGHPALLAVAQMVYQMAAAILILYERERQLFLTLVPGVLFGLLYLLLPSPLGAVVAAAAVGLSLVLALAAALRATQRGLEPKQRSGVTRQDVLAALPFALYGTLCALLVSFDTLRFWSWIGLTGLGLTIAPLVLSMGVLEWQLRQFRERVAVLLARTNSPRDFGEGVWKLFVLALSRYSLLLAGLSLGALPLVLAPERDPVLLGAALLANWILGCAFFIGFALISQGRIDQAIVYLALALALHALDVQLRLPFGSLVIPAFASSYLLSCLVFALLLSVIAKPILCEIRNYRYDLEATRYGQTG